MDTHETAETVVAEFESARNDREWTLIGFGDTPKEALQAAIRNEGGK